jgi:hypothetical protein
LEAERQARLEEMKQKRQEQVSTVFEGAFVEAFFEACAFLLGTTHDSYAE